MQNRYLKVVQNKEKLWELPQGPRVVLASVASLAAGMSLQLLVDWAPNPANLIIFPGKAPVSRTATLDSLYCHVAIITSGEYMQYGVSMRLARTPSGQKGL